MTAKEHNKLLSIFFFVYTALTFLGGTFGAIIYIAAGAVVYSNPTIYDSSSLGVFVIILSIIIGVLVLLLCGFYGFSAWKMYKEQKSGRTLGIICSCIFLLGIPLGTILGVYGLWFLLGEKGKQFYSDNFANGNYAPPPPNNWQ